MILHRFPGFQEDPGAGRFWPLLVVSVLLHAGLFWGFSRFHIRSAMRALPAPIAMIELGGSRPGTIRKASTPLEKPPGPSRPSEPVLPRLLPPRTQEVEKPIRVPEPPSRPPSSPESTAKRAPITPPAPPPALPKPREVEFQDDHVAAKIARLREKTQVSGEDAVAERIARIKEKSGEAASETEVANRIAKLKDRQILGSDAQVARRIEALREKYGTREPARLPPRSGAIPGESPVGVQGAGAQGVAGFVEARYVKDVMDHLANYWSVPDVLKGKGYRASATVFVDRRGAITDLVIQRSGNKLFDERVERAIAEANPLPPVPNGLSGQRFEYEIRFSAP